jgi:hypothetical protein
MTRAMKETTCQMVLVVRQRANRSRTGAIPASSSEVRWSRIMADSALLVPMTASAVAASALHADQRTAEESVNTNAPTATATVNKAPPMETGAYVLPRGHRTALARTERTAGRQYGDARAG